MNDYPNNPIQPDHNSSPWGEQNESQPWSYPNPLPPSSKTPLQNPLVSSGSSLGKIILMIVLVLAAAGAGVWGAYYFLKLRSDKQPIYSDTAVDSQMSVVDSEAAQSQITPSESAADEILPTGITLPKRTVTLQVGDHFQYPDVRVTPEQVRDQGILWYSSAPEVAAVDSSGMIVGVSAGECTITVRANANKEISAGISVTVTYADTTQNESSEAAGTQTTQRPNYPYHGEGYLSADHSGDKIPMYERPSSQSKVVQNIPDGTLLKLYESDEIFWYYATYNGISGYVCGNVTDKNNELFDGNGYLAFIATTTGESVNLRSTPSKNGKILTQIPYGAEVYAGTVIGEWRGVSYYENEKKYQGFVAARFVTDHLDTKLLTGYISTTSGSSVNLRSRPSTNSDIITTIPNGAAVIAEGWVLYADEWYYVNYNGQFGYVRKDLIRR